MINTEYNKATESTSNAGFQESPEQAKNPAPSSLSQKTETLPIAKKEHHKSHKHKGHTTVLQLGVNPTLFQQNVAKLAKKCTELPEYISKQRQEAKALEDSENIRAELVAIRKNRQILREQNEREQTLNQDIHYPSMLEIRE